MVFELSDPTAPYSPLPIFDDILTTSLIESKYLRGPSRADVWWQCRWVFVSITNKQNETGLPGYIHAQSGSFSTQDT